MNELLLVLLCFAASFISAVAVNMYLAGDCCGKKRIELPIGSTYGDWTILEPAGVSLHGRFQYKCSCVCGSIILIDATGLKNGSRTKCKECFHEQKRKHFQQKEIGKAYHGWKVIEFAGITSNKGGTNSMYLVEHFCGYRTTPKIFQHIKHKNVKSIRCYSCNPRIE